MKSVIILGKTKKLRFIIRNRWHIDLSYKWNLINIERHLRHNRIEYKICLFGFEFCVIDYSDF